MESCAYQPLPSSHSTTLNTYCGTDFALSGAAFSKTGCYLCERDVRHSCWRASPGRTASLSGWSMLKGHSGRRGGATAASPWCHRPPHSALHLQTWQKLLLHFLLGWDDSGSPTVQQSWLLRGNSAEGELLISPLTQPADFAGIKGGWHLCAVISGTPERPFLCSPHCPTPTQKKPPENSLLYVAC
ncbi:uncharacterized protein LOC132352311 isoform X2 [Balaenoptera ricei]|uniref:uncharacterized protein LOC132352311 isoform X2 n=1 Tax=Balaenoptera ricei TaxID=2746895 RepID=UPI0028BF1E6D|nr:uncharacterized protein LOC132352311 isoform X2 [Balaenoptera ricei]